MSAQPQLHVVTEDQDHEKGPRAREQVTQLVRTHGPQVAGAVWRFVKAHKKATAAAVVLLIFARGFIGALLGMAAGGAFKASGIVPVLIVGVILLGLWDIRRQRQAKADTATARTIYGTIQHEPLSREVIEGGLLGLALHGLELVFHGLSVALTPAEQRGKVKPLDPPKRDKRYLIRHKKDGTELVSMPHDSVRDFHNDQLMAVLAKALSSVKKKPVRLTMEFSSATLVISETVEIPKWVPNTPAGLIPLHQRGLIPLGVLAHGRPAFWNLEADNPHLLATGVTGAGKTGLVRTVATQSALRGHDVRLVDVKTELEPFADFPGVTEFASEPKDVEEVIHEVYVEMKRRQQAHDQGKHIILVVEEYAELIRVAPKVNSRQQAVEDVQSIAALGRKHNVHLVVATQRPDSKLIGGSFRDNLGFRVGFAGLSPDGWEMVTGQRANPGIEDSPGRALLVHGRDRIGSEFQAAYTGDPEDRKERQQSTWPEVEAALDDLWQAAGAQRVTAEDVEQTDEDAAAVDAAITALGIREEVAVTNSPGEATVSLRSTVADEAEATPRPGEPGGPCLALVVTKPDGSPYSPATVAFWPKGKRCEHVGCQQLRRQHAREQAAKKKEREANGSRAKRVNPTRAMKEEVGDECAVCGSTEGIEYDHADGDRTNTTVDNLVPLCHEHHVAKTHGRL